MSGMSLLNEFVLSDQVTLKKEEENPDQIPCCSG